MRLSEKDFFNNQLDLSVKELCNAADCYGAGDCDQARRIFAGYIKSALCPERRDQIAESFGDGCGKYSEEEWVEMILDGYVRPVDFLFRFPDGKIIWDYNATPNGYVEWVFHLQYHTELVYLGRAYKRTGDEKYAKRAVDIIASWIEQVERPDVNTFVSTYRSLETGNRMANSWPYFIHAFLHSPTVSDELWVKIFISVWEQADFLYHEYTNRNWLIHELYGLISASVFSPFSRTRMHGTRCL